jgi:hypothetical protein
VPTISDHRKEHREFNSSEELGYYLAGLIEGDGNFGKRSLEIVLNKKDIG